MLIEGQPSVYQFELNPNAMKQLNRLIKELDTFCFENRIPYFFTAAVADDGKETSYCQSVRTGLPMGVHLSDEQLTSHLKVCRGGEVVFPENLPEIDLINDEEDLIPMELPADVSMESPDEGEETAKSPVEDDNGGEN